MNKEKINIMHIVLNLEMGGSENCVVNIAKKIDKKQFRVFICCLEEKGILAREFEPLGIPVYALKKGAGFDIKIIWRLIRLFREKKIDTIHSHHLGPLIYSLPAAKIAGIKTIIHTEHSYKYMDENKKLFFIAKLLFKGVNKVVGVCDDVTLFLKDTMKIKPANVMTILNGIEIDRFSKSDSIKRLSKRKEIGIDENDFVIGTIGRLDAVKNHKGLLHAFKEAINIIPNARLVIVGGGELKNDLEGLGNELGISSSIKLLGTRNDTPDLLNIMDIFILPSLSEGLSVALLEAMASKRPIIASNVDGNRNIIEDNKNGMLISPQSTQNIADVIIELYGNSEKRKRLSEAGYSLVKEKHSLSTMTRAYQELYREGS